MGGGGCILKQLNYSISMLPILFASIYRIVNDIKTIPVKVVNVLFLLIQTCVAKKRFIEEQLIINENV